VCILSGGLGTRLGDLVADTPKPLLEVAGEPFLFHQLRLLAAHGATSVVLCVGYRGEQIEKAIGAERYGIRVAYSYDGPQVAGTLGAIKRALSLLPSRFLILYGDTYLRIDYRDVARAWRESGLPALMTVLRNDGRWDRSNARLEGDRVVAYDKAAPTPEMRWIDYGLGGLERQLVEEVRSESDLSALQSTLAAQGRLFGYLATERFFEIGTPEALAETDRFLRSHHAYTPTKPR
jgi:NDP-sugar pyrophosphorylase family protein